MLTVMSISYVCLSTSVQYFSRLPHTKEYCYSPSLLFGHHFCQFSTAGLGMRIIISSHVLPIDKDIRYGTLSSHAPQHRLNVTSIWFPIEFDNLCSDIGKILAEEGFCPGTVGTIRFGIYYHLVVCHFFL